MNTINRFILKSYLPPFAMTFVISVFILFMQFLWKWIDELVGKGLETSVVVELFFYAALSMVPLALPLATLLSSLMTFGGLAEHYELAAFKASGLSLMRIMRPLCILSFVVSIGAFIFANNVLPYTNLQMLSTLFDIRQQKPALNIKEGVFYKEIDGFSIRIKNISKDGNTLNDVMIYDHTDQMGNTSLSLAETGTMTMSEDKRFLVIELRNGKTYKEIWNQEGAAQKKPFMTMKFDKQIIRMDLSGFSLKRTDQDLFKDNHQMLNGAQLLAYIDTMQTELKEDKINFYPSLRNAYLGKTKFYWTQGDSLKKKSTPGNMLDSLDEFTKIRTAEIAINSARNCKSASESKVNEIEAQQRSITRFEIEFWRKYSLSFACLIMFFIGAPLGAIIRKGGLGMPVVISIILFIVFWVLSITGEKISKEGDIPPYLGMWLSCAFFLPLGIWLTIKATGDAALFDTESYISFFRKIFIRKSVDVPMNTPSTPLQNDQNHTDNEGPSGM